MQPLPLPERRRAYVAIAAATIMSVLDGTIANTAPPAIARELHDTPAASIWIVNGFQLALTATLFAWASFGQLRGLARGWRYGWRSSPLVAGGALAHVLPVLVAARMHRDRAGAIMSIAPALLRWCSARASGARDRDQRARDRDRNRGRTDDRRCDSGSHVAVAVPRQRSIGIGIAWSRGVLPSGPPTGARLTSRACQRGGIWQDHLRSTAGRRAAFARARRTRRRCRGVCVVHPPARTPRTADVRGQSVRAVVCDLGVDSFSFTVGWRYVSPLLFDELMRRR